MKTRVSRFAEIGLFVVSFTLCALAVEGVAYLIVSSDRGYYEADVRNALGLRDSREPFEAAGRPVVIAVGDSFTYGLGVPYTESYPAQLEAKLRQVSPDVAVINAGRPGLDTAGALDLLKRMYAEYQPQVVILGFHPADVVQNQQTFAERERDSQQAPAAAEHVANVDETIERAERNSPMLFLVREFLRQKTSTFALLDYLYKTYVIKYLPAPTALTATGTGAEFDPTERFLDEIHEYLAANGDAELVLLGIVALVRFDQYPYMNLNARLQAYARSRGIHFIDTLSEFSKHSSQDFWVSVSDGHYNAQGNAVVSEAVSAYMLEHGLLGLAPAGPRTSSVEPDVTAVPTAVTR